MAEARMAETRLAETRLAEMVPDQVTVVRHPLVQHKLTLLRRSKTATANFRQITRELSLLLAYEVTRDLPLELVEIETPMEPMDAPSLAGKKLCFVSILRAGNGILDGMLDLVPSARVGHIGLYRDPATLIPVEYYLKLPDDVADRLVIVVDPMLATGHRRRFGPSTPGRSNPTPLRLPARRARVAAAAAAIGDPSTPGRSNPTPLRLPARRARP